MSRAPGPCEVPMGPHSERVRLYPAGWLCTSHSPWAVAGQPEPLPGPGWPAAAWATPTPNGMAHLIDERAIASGKRRSSQTTYRAAQAAVRRKDSPS